MPDGESSGRGKWSRRAILAAAGTGATGAVANALSNDDNTLFAGTMALDQAYNVSGKLWIGPDSAKDTVEAQDGRVFMAADTQVEYYGDDGSWVLMGIGSDEQPVPSVSTGDGNIGDVDGIKAPGYAGEYDTLQAAIDAIASDGGMVLVPHTRIHGQWEETINFPTDTNSIRVQGHGINSRILAVEGSDDHAVTVDQEDIHLQNLWIDNHNTENSYDAVHVTSNEGVLEDIDVDVTDRHAICVSGRNVKIRGGRLRQSGVSSAALQLDNAELAKINGLTVEGAVERGIEGSVTNLQMSGSSFEDAGENDNMRLTINGYSNIQATVRNATRYGALFKGTGKLLANITAEGNGGPGVVFDGQNQIVHGNVDGIRFAGATDCVFQGDYDADLTVGSGAERCVVNGKVVAPETISMGGSSGNISPTALPAENIPVFVDPGGSNVTLNGIGGINREGQQVTLVNVAGGSQNITLADEASPSSGSRFNNQGSANDTLAPDQMAQYQYQSHTGNWRQIMPAT